MGHLAGKSLFRRLGDKIDGLNVRAPWSGTFHELLRELYLPEEAELVVRMPYGMADISRIARATGIEEAKLQPMLERMADKGLVMDLEIAGVMLYAPSPVVVGLFEFTMMRVGNETTRKAAALFNRYLQEEGEFLRANFGSGQRVSYVRTLPHQETVPEEYLEVLDYESASELIDRSRRFSVGVCSCRHEKLHLGHEPCGVPLESCTSFGIGADYLIRHGFAREICKEEMHELFARSRELGVVLCADNVRRNVTYICHCCGCCCDALIGIRRHGYENAVVSSSFLVDLTPEKCTGCGRCVAACPVEALKMSEGTERHPQADSGFCLGCGVCALACPAGACTMVKRTQRVLHPESVFEKIFLQSLERGTVGNQLFDDPSRLSHRFLRGVVGGFLRLPGMKRALMSEALRSRFLSALKEGARLSGKRWATEL